MISFRQSADGSMSAYNAEFDECYHSLKDGALNESLYKHIYPSLQHCKTHYGDTLEALPNALYVLDICFGLGYNTLALLSTLARGQILGVPFTGKVKIYSPEKDESVFKMLHNLCFGLGYNTLALLSTLARGQILGVPFTGKVKIYSPEKDESVFKMLHNLTYPPYMSDILQLNEMLEHFESARQVSQYYGKIGDMEFEICLYKGDAIVFLENLKRDLCNAFHIVFQDAFSPKKNPSLWSREYFALLYHLLHTQGIITTYSQSRAVRENAINAGFRVYDYKPGNACAINIRGGSLMGKEALSLENLKEIFHSQSPLVSS